VTVQKGKNTLYPALRTPELDDDGRRVVYEILDLDRHMDSSEMTPSGEFRPSSLSSVAAGPGKLTACKAGNRGLDRS
jgi:hypothetical protein